MGASLIETMRQAGKVETQLESFKTNEVVQGQIIFWLCFFMGFCQKSWGSMRHSNCG